MFHIEVYELQDFYFLSDLSHLSRAISERVESSDDCPHARPRDLDRSDSELFETTNHSDMSEPSSCSSSEGEGER